MRLPYVDPRVTGGHERAYESGETELFWRCENCGHTATDPELRKACPVCHRGGGMAAVSWNDEFGRPDDPKRIVWELLEHGDETHTVGARPREV